MLPLLSIAALFLPHSGVPTAPEDSSFRAGAAVAVQEVTLVHRGRELGPEVVPLPAVRGEYAPTATLESPHAVQAAAADERFVYAVANATVAKYDRATGKELGVSTGKAEHLNSGFLWGGKLYCAHSNYPKTPAESDIRVLDPATMKLEVFRRFEDAPGSLTWAVRRDGWWCCFAHYGKDNGKTVLVHYDDAWKEVGRWTFPPELVADWGSYSLSGGLWLGDELLTTGHDRKVIYRLKLPTEGTVMQVVGMVATPFPGQGIAIDPKGGLVGIDRAKKAVVFARPEGKE